MELRVEIGPDPGTAEILADMAGHSDPTRRLDELRAAIAEATARTARALRKPVDRLRTQILLDLREVGADAVAYIEHMDRSLRSRQFTDGPKLARSLGDTLTPVRRRAKVVAH